MEQFPAGYVSSLFQLAPLAQLLLAASWGSLCRLKRLKTAISLRGSTVPIQFTHPNGGLGFLFHLGSPILPHIENQRYGDFLEWRYPQRAGWFTV